MRFSVWESLVNSPATATFDHAHLAYVSTRLGAALDNVGASIEFEHLADQVLNRALAVRLLPVDLGLSSVLDLPLEILTLAKALGLDDRCLALAILGESRDITGWAR